MSPSEQTPGAWPAQWLRGVLELAVLAVVELDARFESRTGAGLADPAVEPLGRVQMPPGAWRSLLDDRRLQGGDAIDAATVLEGSPVAIWVTDEGEHDGR